MSTVPKPFQPPRLTPNPYQLMNHAPKVWINPDETRHPLKIYVYLHKIPARDILKSIILSHLKCDPDNLRIFDVHKVYCPELKIEEMRAIDEIKVKAYYSPNSSVELRNPSCKYSKIQLDGLKMRSDTGIPISEQAKQLRAFTKRGVYERICKLAVEKHHENDYTNFMQEPTPSRITWFFPDDSVLIREGYGTYALPK